MINELSGTMMDEHPHLTLQDKAANWLAWGVSIALFWHIGWVAMAPDDPLGAVSILARKTGLLMLVQAAGLAVVAGAAGGLLAGRRVAGAGIFAAAIGLVAVSVRGRTIEKLLISPSGSTLGLPALSRELALESLGWFAVILVASMTSTLITRWCYGAGRRSTPVAVGLTHAGIAAFTGLVAFHVFSAGLTHRAIAHGQACFVAAAAAALGCYVAHRMAPVSTVRWSVFGVGVMSVLGYVWAAIRPGNGSLPPGIPGSPFLRVLPIQMVSASTAAAVAVFWYVMAVPASDAISERDGDPRGVPSSRR